MHVMMPHLAHPEGHTDRYLCILYTGGGVGRQHHSIPVLYTCTLE